MESQTLVKEICPTTTQSWIKKGALLVDVREPNEVERVAFDVPDLLPIPLSEFEERYSEIPKNKDVVVVCQAGQRSLRAADFLINHGYDLERVVNMQYGLTRWVEKGFPVKRANEMKASQTSAADVTKKQSITILDPALCCSTGVCGPDVDDALVQTAANVKWLKSLGFEVNRHNLSNDAEAFKSYPQAVEKLQKEGGDSLPYILIDGKLMMAGKYPDKAQWLDLLGEDMPDEQPVTKATDKEKLATLISIGASMATASDEALTYYTEQAMMQEIDLSDIALAMNAGNGVRRNAGNKTIDKANRLLSDLQPKTNESCCGSGPSNGSSCC